jgi:S-formylglutathione hydrolase FrmB
MGGYGAAIIGLHHPELFTQIVTLAGYFIIDDLTFAFGHSPENDDKIAYQTPDVFLSRAKDFRWFLAESPTDPNALVQGQAASWSQKLRLNGASATLSAEPGGHTYDFSNNEMSPVANWFIWPKVTTTAKNKK